MSTKHSAPLPPDHENRDVRFRAVEGGDANLIELAHREDLFENDILRSIKSRALAYLRAGVAVHFRGPAGAGKTTLALQIATQLNRPTVLLTGDASFTAQNLIGSETGVKIRQVEDNFIHNVRKSERETTRVWEDQVLTKAVTRGYTLVYDEFTRSSAEANNPLLPVLEEGVLPLTTAQRDRRYVEAHCEFRAIFTSNPNDYAGVTTPQDALIDRMITFDLEWHDAATETGIVAARSHLDPELCAPIVELVRALRAQTPEGGVPPSMRSAVMIARVARAQNLTPNADDPRYVQLCLDALASRGAPAGEDHAARVKRLAQLAQLVRAHSVVTPAHPTAFDPAQPQRGAA